MLEKNQDLGKKQWKYTAEAGVLELDFVAVFFLDLTENYIWLSIIDLTPNNCFF